MLKSVAELCQSWCWHWLLPQLQRSFNAETQSVCWNFSESTSRSDEEMQFLTVELVAHPQLFKLSVVSSKIWTWVNESKSLLAGWVFRVSVFSLGWSSSGPSLPIPQIFFHNLIVMLLQKKIPITILNLYLIAGITCSWQVKITMGKCQMGNNPNILMRF